MDYTVVSDSIRMMMKAQGIDEMYIDKKETLYYDESGNIKHLIVKDGKLNADSDTVFVLGGVQADDIMSLDELKTALGKTLEKEISIYPTQIKAYIDDSFDFRDQPMQFVGAWDYENVEFKEKVSIKEGYIKDGIVNNLNAIPLVKIDKNISKDFKEVIMRNLDYQNTQKYFNLGLDFLVMSLTFKNIVVPQNFDYKKLFRLYLNTSLIFNL